jgi:hypothetical protein
MHDETIKFKKYLPQKVTNILREYGNPYPEATVLIIILIEGYVRGCNIRF